MLVDVGAVGETRSVPEHHRTQTAIDAPAWNEGLGGLAVSALPRHDASESRNATGPLGPVLLLSRRERDRSRCWWWDFKEGGVGAVGSSGGCRPVRKLRVQEQGEFVLMLLQPLLLVTHPSGSAPSVVSGRLVNPLLHEAMVMRLDGEDTVSDPRA